VKHDRDLAGAYALNALTAEERAAYERAIDGSEEARSEATELQDTAVILGLSVTPVEPPAALRARLLQSIAATPQHVDVAPGPAATRAGIRWSRLALAATSVAASLALILGGIAIATNLLSPEPSSQAEQMAELKQAPDMREMQAELPTGEHVMLRWSHELATSAVIVDGMDPAPSDKVYQLWYIDSDGARPAGILSIEDEGASWRVLDGDMDADDKVGVTVEPMGGSDQPTTDPIVVLEP
jgi:anti-sigma-K factor RskA